MLVCVSLPIRDLRSVLLVCVSVAVQAYEHVTNEDGQLLLFSAEVLPNSVLGSVMRTHGQIAHSLHPFRWRALFCERQVLESDALMRCAAASVVDAQGLPQFVRHAHHGHLDFPRQQN